MQDAWTRGQPVTLHGWVYALDNGLVNDLKLAADTQDALEANVHAALARYDAPPPGL